VLLQVQCQCRSRLRNQFLPHCGRLYSAAPHLDEKEVLELVAVEEAVDQRGVMPDFQYQMTICACWEIDEIDRLGQSMSFALQVAL
jgi:hypothetical protein